MDLLGYDVSITPQFDECNVKRALDCKFTVKNSYSMVYMDFDDTLVEDGKVKLETIKFVYQCRNAGIPIVLLTRHVKDIYKSLAESGISESLFSEIHVLTEDETKSSYIEQGSDAIFIDDSYAERKDVFDHCAIKTFGLDNLDVLIND